MFDDWMNECRLIGKKRFSEKVRSDILVGRRVLEWELFIGGEERGNDGDWKRK